MPSEKFVNGGWPHPARLPLASGWRGTCTAPGHEGELPSAEQLQDFCNLGYAQTCSRLPHDRAWDAVRFSIVSPRFADAVSDASRAATIRLHYVCERAHLPVNHDVLEFDVTQLRWVRRHPDARVQRMAECFLSEYLSHRKPNHE